MFEQTFKNIDDILHKDAGCGSELDYVEQTSWVLFLKYLDDFEMDKKTAAELSGKTYTEIIDPQYRWGKWAMPKLKDGKADHHKAATGDDLKDFVDHKLFPILKSLKVMRIVPIQLSIKLVRSLMSSRTRFRAGIIYVRFSI